MTSAEMARAYLAQAALILELVSISRRLRGEREVAFYGDEAVGAPPEQLYTAADASEALADARFVLDRCRAGVPPAG